MLLFLGSRRMKLGALTGGAALLLAAGCSGADEAADTASRSDIEEVVAAATADTASRSDIDEMVSAAVADLSGQMLAPGDVDRIVSESIAGIAPPGAGLTLGDLLDSVSELRADISAQLEQLESGLSSAAAATSAQDQSAEDAAATAPPKSAQADYTRYFVGRAIERYESEGLDATVQFYNSEESVDGQWYVFVVDEDAKVIAHPDPLRLGLDLNGPVGTDINGYVFGADMLTATEDGKWVPYVYVNPAEGTLGDDAGAFQLKNAWVERHDGLLFASGWYIDTEEFVPALMAESAEHFRTGGLKGILAFYNDPQGLSAGLVPTVQYYNNTDTLDGYFAGFIAAPDGTLLQHLDPALIGTDIVDLLGPAVRDASTEGGWITAQDNPPDAGGPQSMRVWAIDVDGTIIGGGWYRE